MKTRFIEGSVGEALALPPLMCEHVNTRDRGCLQGQGDFITTYYYYYYYNIQ